MAEIDGNQPCAECGDPLVSSQGLFDWPRVERVMQAEDGYVHQTCGLQRALRALVETVKGIEERVRVLEERDGDDG